MALFKTLNFNKWMRKVKLSDQILCKAVSEMANGLIDADLGRGLFKKRVALTGYGKSGGTRILLATNRKNKWIFLYGYKKNEREAISREELESLQTLSADFLKLSEQQLIYMVDKGKLLEVLNENDS